MTDILAAPDSAISRYANIPDDEFLKIYGDALEQVEFMKAMFCMMEDELIRRGIERKATHIFGVDGAQVEIKHTFEYEKRFDILDELKDVPTLAPSELSKALYETEPTPERKADATKLKALAKKHGGQVAEIISRGLKSYPKGRPKLVYTAAVISPEKSSVNVTAAV